MAPKKNIAVLPQKVTKKRVRKDKPVKPPLKTPTIIKVKIGNSGSNPSSRRVNSQRKIELANEVALAQLQNKSSNVSPKLFDSLATQVAPSIAELVETANPPEVTKKHTPKWKRTDTSAESKSDNSDEMNQPLIHNIHEHILSKNRKRIFTPKAKEAKFQDSSCRSPAKRKCVKRITPEYVSDVEYTSVKKKPGPKSKTTPKLKDKAIAKPLQDTQCNSSNEGKTIAKTASVTKTKNGPESPVTPAKGFDKKSRLLKKADTEKKDQKKLPTMATTPKRRPNIKNKKNKSEKGTTKTRSTRNKGKGLNAKEIEASASMLETALGNMPGSRCNSRNSDVSNLSWTKDISVDTASSLNSDTTTCVTVSSTDIVRFNNKLPFVQLDSNLEQSTNEKSSKSESSSSTDSSSDSDTSQDSDLDLTCNPDLNLSTSSLTLKSPRSENTPDNTELLCLEMDKLTNSLKNFYTEMSKWIVCDEDDSCDFSTILNTMNLENDVLSRCDNFKNILDAIKCVSGNTTPVNHGSHKNNITNPETRNQKDNSDVEDTKCGYKENNSPESSPELQVDRENNASDESNSKFIKPFIVRRMSVAKKRDTQPKFPAIKIPVPPVSEVLNPQIPPEDSCDTVKTFTGDFNYVSCYKACDDEDALSLYAESITGVESSRKDSSASVSNASIQDVYIPKSTSRAWMYEKYVYQPTRIEDSQTEVSENTEIQQTNEANTISACVSSSIPKDLDTNKQAKDQLIDVSRQSPLADASTNKRLFAQYKPMNPVKSSLYRGKCFFYIAVQCKNIKCWFPHEDIDLNLFKCRLTTLIEDNLIEEYILTRNYNVLRRKFGLCFVEECKRRKATRMLMEMALDLGLGVVEWDENLNVKVLETTLLHLNSISLDACDDQLMFQHKDVMLCDALLRCIANSQNFAQFKRAFTKLATFMWDIKRPVDINIVGSILERVCILPGEDYLAKGMLNLMRNTNERIFENSMVKSFEVQLSNIETDVYDAYLVAKKVAFEVLLAQSQASAQPVGELVNHSPTIPDQNHMVVTRMDRHTSPDSTNFDNLHTENVPETTFKCTIDTDVIRDLFKSPSMPVPKQCFTKPRMQNWRRGRGHAMRGSMRGVMHGQANTTMKAGCRVFRTQSNYRNGAST